MFFPFLVNALSSPSSSSPSLTFSSFSHSQIIFYHFYRRNERATPAEDMDLVSGSREEQDEEDFDAQSTAQKGFGKKLMAYVL